MLGRFEQTNHVASARLNVRGAVGDGNGFDPYFGMRQEKGDRQQIIRSSVGVDEYGCWLGQYGNAR